MHKILISNGPNIKCAAEVLSSDGLVVIPTETVYGLCGNAYSDVAVAEIFRCKNRSRTNPLSVCYTSLEAAGDDVEINADALILSRNFLPGPLTIVLKRRPTSRLSFLCSAGSDTVGLRVSSNSLVQDLLSRLSFPLVLTSANRSEGRSPVTAQEASDDLQESEHLIILDGGRCFFGWESTVVDLTSEQPKIIRGGVVDEEEISQKLNAHLKNT